MPPEASVMVAIGVVIFLCTIACAMSSQRRLRTDARPGAPVSLPELRAPSVVAALVVDEGPRLSSALASLRSAELYAIRRAKAAAPYGPAATRWRARATAARELREALESDAETLGDERRRLGQGSF